MIGYRSYLYNPDIPEDFLTYEEDLVSIYRQKYFTPVYSYYNAISPFAKYDNTPELYNNVIIGDFVNECGMLFANCRNFNKNVRYNNLGDCEGMFYMCSNYNQPMTFEYLPFDCTNMFGYCYSLNSPITFKNNYPGFFYSGKFNRMFSYCTNFNQPIVIPNSVSYLVRMFSYCTNFNQDIVIPQKSINCIEMFYGCYNYGSNIYFRGNTSRSLNCYSMLTSRYHYDYVYNNETHSYEQVYFPAPAVHVYVHPNLADTVMNNIIYGITWTELTDGNGWYNDSPNYNVYIHNNYEG